MKQSTICNHCSFVLQFVVYIYPSTSRSGIEGLEHLFFSQKGDVLVGFGDLTTISSPQQRLDGGIRGDNLGLRSALVGAQPETIANFSQALLLLLQPFDRLSFPEKVLIWTSSIGNSMYWDSSLGI